MRYKLCFNVIVWTSKEIYDYLRCFCGLNLYDVWLLFHEHNVICILYKALLGHPTYKSHHFKSILFGCTDL
jgi:hypothetical protein